MPLLQAAAKRLAGLEDFVRKNVKALIAAKGYEVVQTRRRGARRLSTGLLKASKADPAARPQPQPLDPRRFFTIEIEARPGINHLRYALTLMIAEAAALGRTPVVFKPRFDPRHNLGKELDAEWDRYIDLAQIELHEPASGRSVVVRALQPAEVAGWETLSMARFERNHCISAEENRRYDLIVRHNKTGLHIDAVHDGAAGLPGWNVRFKPSRRVLDLVDEVAGRLGSYCAMHVRRDDMLEMKDLYPNLERDTHPERILETLSRHLPTGSRVYIMTNERERGFFEPLKRRYEVFQYFDFPALHELIECEHSDNFLLFEVEKVLFEKAATKVHTFAHPEGGARISLTADKGWA